jgi:ribosomal protein L19
MNAQTFLELFQLSMKEKKGITFFLPGQTIAGVVTKVVDTEAVEARSQTYSRIIIRLDQILAAAVN